MPIYSFDEAKHVHKLDGKRIKGCTTILGIIAKPQLIQWSANLAAAEAFRIGSVDGLVEKINEFEKIDSEACKQIDLEFPEFAKARLAHKEKKDNAAEWGKIVHKAIEVWIKTKNNPTVVEIGGEQVKLLDEHIKAVNQFITWATKNDVEFLLSEKGIYSEIWQIGGIVDFVCKIKGILYVGDIKTSSDIYEEYFLQCSAYAKMMTEMGLYDNFDNMIIINTKKDGTFKTEERNNVKDDIKCFEAAIILHNRLK